MPMSLDNTTDNEHASYYRKVSGHLLLGVVRIYSRKVSLAGMVTSYAVIAKYLISCLDSI